MDETRHQYIPALRFGWLTGLYDPVIRWTMREDLFKPGLVEQVGMQPGHRVLDLGCGTATLTILLKQRQPQSTVAGIDGDPVVLARAREKAAEAGVDPLGQQAHLRRAIGRRMLLPGATRVPFHGLHGGGFLLQCLGALGNW